MDVYMSRQTRVPREMLACLLPYIRTYLHLYMLPSLPPRLPFPFPTLLALHFCFGADQLYLGRLLSAMTPLPIPPFPRSPVPARTHTSQAVRQHGTASQARMQVGSQHGRQHGRSNHGTVIRQTDRHAA